MSLSPSDARLQASQITVPVTRMGMTFVFIGVNNWAFVQTEGLLDGVLLCGSVVFVYQSVSITKETHGRGENL